LRAYFNKWGIHITDETFQKIYDELDWDKDGRVSYSDFQKTIGKEIHPGESLYFRQD
jgi:Ca2+-binding EF-hand superfamily protein